MLVSPSLASLREIYSASPALAQIVAVDRAISACRRHSLPQTAGQAIAGRRTATPSALAQFRDVLLTKPAPGTSRPLLACLTLSGALPGSGCACSLHSAVLA